MLYFEEKETKITFEIIWSTSQTSTCTEEITEILNLLYTVF